MGNNSNHVFSVSPMMVAVIGIVLASVGLLIYHFIVVLWCNRREIDVTHQETMSQHSMTNFEDLSSSLETSIAALIPTCEYTRDVGLVSKSEDVTCAVCLNEFKDGEAVRVLPECLHTFHVPCIDMWLYSHSDCPLCRTDTGLSTPVYHQSESDTNTLGLPD